MRDAVEKAREELRRTLRDRFDKTREMKGPLSQSGEKAKDDEPAAEAEGPAKPGDVEQAAPGGPPDGTATAQGHATA